MPTRAALGAKALAAMALLLCAILLVPSSAHASRTLGLSSGKFRFDIAAGGRVDGEVVVINSGTETLTVMVYASDQEIDDKGNITYKTPSRTDLQSTSLPSAWVTIKMPADSKSLGNVPYLELKPGERVPVRFTITVPPAVPAGDHNMLLFFESFVHPELGNDVQSRVSGRVGSRITLRVEGKHVRKLEVRPFDVPAYVIGGSIPFEFLIRNTGNIDQRVGARVLLLNRTDHEIQRKTPVDGQTVFAGTNLEATGTVVADKMPIGPYKVRVDVTPVDDLGHAINGGADTITLSHQVWLIPYWAIVLIVLIVLLLVSRIVWVIARAVTRQRVRREQEKSAMGMAPPPQ